MSATAESPGKPRPRWQDEPVSPRRVVEAFGQTTLDFISELGAMLLFGLRMIPALLGPPYRVQLWFREMEFVGVGSVFIIAVTGAFMGMVLVLEGLWAFSSIHQEQLVGSTVEMFLAREMAPVFGGIIITARAGAAITTELGSMRVTEQIDALEAMAVDPMNYLVAPRVLAVTVMVPVLTLIFNVVGFGAAYAVFVYGQGYEDATFWANVTHFFEVSDLTHGLWKAVWFGLITSLIACYMGYHARGGAAGVGVATTRSVVYGCVAIFFLDYVVTAVGVDI
jgi:phospholipid/cholesterol/gamma-HCH transport system permease protein